MCECYGYGLTKAYVDAIGTVPYHVQQQIPKYCDCCTGPARAYYDANFLMDRDFINFPTWFNWFKSNLMVEYRGIFENV